MCTLHVQVCTGNYNYDIIIYIYVQVYNICACVHYMYKYTMDLVQLNIHRTLLSLDKHTVHIHVYITYRTIRDYF